jgi:hypothetical protein
MALCPVNQTQPRRRVAVAQAYPEDLEIWAPILGLGTMAVASHGMK